MKNFLLTVSMLLLAFQMNAQTVFWSESFETANSPVRYTPEVEALPSATNASCHDHFARNLSSDGCSGDEINIFGTTEYTDLDGSYLWAGEDLDDDGVGGSGNSELVITFDNIPTISGKTDLAISGLFGAGGNDEFENADFILVEYQIDGGGYVNALSFRGNATKYLALDTDNDGVGDGTELDKSLTEFVAFISTTGTTLDLRVTAKINSADEEFAFDFFQLYEDFPNPLLPITLNFFEAKPTNNKSVILTWQTASEENNDYFSIEHSTDGTSFREIATKVGNGTTDIVQNYSFLHENVANGLHYYRLKQVDFDGKFEYSNIVTAKVSHSNDDIFLTPNPTSNVILIQTKTPFERDADFQILNMQGQVVLSSVLQEGTSNVELNISDFPVGIYYLQLFVDNDVMMKKIIKQ